MGIDTDSKEFEIFEAGLKNDENYNEDYINNFLKIAPELTEDKIQNIDKQRKIDLQKHQDSIEKYNANGGFLAEIKALENNSNK